MVHQRHKNMTIVRNHNAADYSAVHHVDGEEQVEVEVMIFPTTNRPSLRRCLAMQSLMSVQYFLCVTHCVDDTVYCSALLTLCVLSANLVHNPHSWRANLQLRRKHLILKKSR